MNIIKTAIEDVYIIQPSIFRDHRGWFLESWSQREMEQNGLNYRFVQDNHAFSEKKGTLRGLHFQNGEFSQAKLVRCVSGSVLEVAVDIRNGSPTYKKWISVELSSENQKQLLIPRGFANGYITLTDNVNFLYKTDNYYNKQSEGAIRWNDASICVDWPNNNPILSEKDSIAPLFDDSIFPYFIYNSSLGEKK